MMRSVAALIVLLFFISIFKSIFPSDQAAAAVGPAYGPAPDIRYVLQTQGGLAAYASLTTSLSLAYVQPLFASVTITASDYLLGEYILAGRPDRVGLAIGRAGWAVAWLPRATTSARFLDCRGTDANAPGNLLSFPEQALAQIASALHITDTAISFFDFRHSQAGGMAYAWLYTKYSGSPSSTLYLPLENEYLERGYVFCTVLNSSQFWLNDELVTGTGSVSSLIYRTGALGPGQLRAGMQNVLRTSTGFSLFAMGYVAGVTAVYSGTTPLQASGGYARMMDLAWPAVIGEPLSLRQVQLPAVWR